jgi:tRNA threonylcarbamoyl adenosine modification protein YjeE
VPTSSPDLVIDLPDEAATRRLAADVAMRLAPGDVIALSGGLGAGKTTFARALLRTLAGDPALEVPSPTFTLVQAYSVGGLAVTHADLYRIADPSELDELGLMDAAEGGVVLVEWPENAGDRLPPERLTVSLSLAGAGRRAVLSGPDAIMARIGRSLAARSLLTAAGWAEPTRRRLAGDASARVYERVASEISRAVLMDWPADGQLAADDPRRRFRARDVTTFVAVDEALAAAGLSVPKILAADLGRGFLLTEDFGDERIAVDDRPVADRYAVAIDALAMLHAAPRARSLPRADGGIHPLPQLSGEVLLAELALFADSYAPHARGKPLPAGGKDELLAIWRTLDARLGSAEQSWVLFDVQSANLFWLPEREGVARVGFIDFQDMFFGPAAYDVACLVFDARADIDAALSAVLVEHYVARRRAADAAFDADSFRAALAIAAALRTMKNMGAFARFAATGKPQYISHLQRASAYLARILSDPVLSALALWYERHLSP